MLQDLSRRKDMCVLCGVSLGQVQTGFGGMRITFWNYATRDKEETTPCGWLTVSGRDIFISSH
jgi:hypothetical protein